VNDAQFCVCSVPGPQLCKGGGEGEGPVFGGCGMRILFSYLEKSSRLSGS